MTKFIITNFATNYMADVKKRLGQDTIIITSNNKINYYKKNLTMELVSIVDLNTFLKQIYKQHLNNLPILTTNEQELFFLKALNNLEDKLKYLKGYQKEIVTDIINIYKEEINEQLIKTKYTNDIFKEINLIIQEYLSLINNKYIDFEQLKQAVLNYLPNNLENKTIIIDIYYFNKLEREIILTLLKNNNVSYMYFLTNQKLQGMEISFNNYLFFAQNLKHEIESLSFEHDEKQFLINNLYNISYDQKETTTYVNIYEASDLYDEVRFVANEIKKQIYLNNYNYSDFAIVTNLKDDYKNYLELIFTADNIPFTQWETINYNFLNYILLLVDIMNNEINKTTLIKLLKLGYYHLTNKQLNDLIKMINNNDMEIIMVDETILSFIEPLKIETPIKIKDLMTVIYNYLEQYKVYKEVNKETWKAFIKVLNSIYNVYKEEQLEISYFQQLLIYFFPKLEKEQLFQNEVQIKDLTNVIGTNSQVLFFIGLNEGVIPPKEMNNKLMPNKEKYYENYERFNNLLISNLQICYTVISPSDKIYISYTKINKEGNRVNPSFLFKKIKNMYKKIKIPSWGQLQNEVYLQNLTYNHYLTFDNQVLKNYLDDYYQNNDYYRSFNRGQKYYQSFYQIENIYLNNQQLSLSPSKMDTYNKCAFQYFCQYILKLEKEETKYRSALVGTYLHYLLANLISHKVPRENIQGYLKFLKEQFYKEQDLTIDSLDNYMFNSLNNNLQKLWPYIYDDYNNNLFKPTYFEFNLSESKCEPLILKEMIIKLNGYIDRVDIYNNYIKVIDYKTFEQTINFNDLIYSLNLQMFIYMLHFKLSNPDLLPAGLFYQSIFVKYESEEFTYKDYRQSGLLLNNDLVIEAMGGEDINDYIKAYRYNKLNENILLKEEEMDELLRFTKKRLLDTATNISEGKFPLNPLKDESTCLYCPYQSICGIEKRDNIYREYKQYSQEEIWEMIRGEISGLDS